MSANLEQERARYQRKLRSDNPNRSGSGQRDRRVRAEVFIDPIKRIGVLPLVQETGLCSRTLYRITKHEQSTVSEDTADRLCVALGIDFYTLPYVREKVGA